MPVARNMLGKQRERLIRSRMLSNQGKKEGGEAMTKEAVKEESTKKGGGWWHSAELWGGLGAVAGWGMSGAAIYDAVNGSAEIISPGMTGVLIVYSSLFARWAFIVKPQNLLLASCHVTNIVAQGNQLRRAIDYQKEQGNDDVVNDLYMKAGAVAAGGAACVALGPFAQSALAGANLGVLSTVAAADAGPFTVHFWAPMSKWLISGASFIDLNRPTDKISIAQYTALTLTGLFFSRYALLVAPINYTLCGVNIALFGSSAWHLGRKIKADFVDDDQP